MVNGLQAYLCLGISDIFSNIAKYVCHTQSESFIPLRCIAEFSGKKKTSKNYQCNSLHCKFCNRDSLCLSLVLLKASVQNTQGKIEKSTDMAVYT